MNLLDILKKIEKTMHTDYGEVIPFDEILRASSFYGLDNSHLLEQKLIELQATGKIKVIFDSNGVLEDMVIGAILNV